MNMDTLGTGVPDNISHLRGVFVVLRFLVVNHTPVPCTLN